MGNETKGYQVTQIAVVVKDLRKTLEIYHKTLGWGPWKVYELKEPRHHHTELRGEEVEYSMVIAETMVGPIEFEVIQPLEGPSIYKEFLEKHGEGIHHIACMGNGANFEENLSAFKQMGLDVDMTGRIDDSIQYYYLNSEPLLKFVLESGSGHAMALKPDWVYPEPNDA